jgi:hypothetical protein
MNNKAQVDLASGWDAIKETPGQVLEIAKEVPGFLANIPSAIGSAFTQFNPLTLILSIVITIVVSALFWMPELMGMKGWPLYIKLMIPPIVLIATYVIISSNSN